MIIDDAKKGREQIIFKKASRGCKYVPITGEIPHRMDGVLRQYIKIP